LPSSDSRICSTRRLPFRTISGNCSSKDLFTLDHLPCNAFDQFCAIIELT
jgi:hypothetical protein